MLKLLFRQSAFSTLMDNHPHVLEPVFQVDGNLGGWYALNKRSKIRRTVCKNRPSFYVELIKKGLRFSWSGGRFTDNQFHRYTDFFYICRRVGDGSEQNLYNLFTD